MNDSTEMTQEDSHDAIDADEAVNMTATELADAIGVAPKAFRSFVRSTVRAKGGRIGADTPGSGGRYVFSVTPSQVDAIAAAYAAHRRTNGAKALDVALLTGDDS